MADNIYMSIMQEMYHIRIYHVCIQNFDKHKFCCFMGNLLSDSQIISSYCNVSKYINSAYILK